MLALIVVLAFLAVTTSGLRLVSTSRHVSRRSRLMSSMDENEVSEKPKKLADQIQDAGGMRNFLVDELMKDRTEEGDAGPLADRDPGLEKPLVLSPAAKERLRKSEELNATVIKATRSAGIIIVGACLALLYLAREMGYTQ